MENVVLKNILVNSDIKKTNFLFYKFYGSDGKWWLIPKKNIEIAFNIYQSFYWKGKLFKSIFPTLSNFNFILKLIGIEKKYLKLNPKLETKLLRTFKSKEILYSIFSGTPSKHQKITMQIHNQKQILGYCKFSNQKELIEIFRGEKKILDFLKINGVLQTPNCLYSDYFNDNIFLFVQNTQKKPSSNVTTKITSYHIEFLFNLFQKTKKKLIFENSDFYISIQKLVSNLHVLNNSDSIIVNEALKLILNRFEKKEVLFSFYHSDFTPWNMIIENYRLFVFDFEYSKYTYPPFIDIFHYFVQTSIFVKKQTQNLIMKNFEINLKNKYFKDVGYINYFMFLCYLIDIISQYLERDKLEFNNITQKKIWISLVKLIIRKIS